MERESREILLVEDESLIAIGTASVLRDNGYAVRIEHSADDAIKAVNERVPDLVLMDIDLGRGKMDGTVAAKKILESHTIPVVFLTNHSEQSTVDRVKGITRYGYVLKNTGDFVLLESISMAFELHAVLQHTRESEEKYRAAFMTSPDAVNINRLDGLYVDINEGFTALTGFTREDVIGKLSSEIGIWAIPEDRERLVEGLKRDGSVENLESQFRRKDGSLTTAVMSARIISINQQPHILSITRDISERKRLEDQLRQSEERFRIAVEGSRAGLWDWHLVTGEAYFNDRFGSMLGYEPGELPATAAAWRNLLHPDDVEAANRRVADYLEGRSKTYESTFRMRTKSGEYRWIIGRGKVVLDNDGNPQRFVGFNTDVTDQKERELNAHRELEAKSVLLEEVNHRVKNNLALITSLIELKRTTSQNDEKLADLSRQVAAVSMVHDSLTSSRHSGSIDIREYCGSLLRSVIDGASRNGIETTVDIDNLHLPGELAIPVGLILNEAATNAVKHGFRSEPNPRLYVRLAGDTEDKECRLVIRNNGSEIPSSVDLSSPATMGMKIITVLAGQIDGIVSIERGPEPTISITFPWFE